MKRENVTLNGQPVGRMKAGWLLFKETWKYFRADYEMIFIPAVTAFVNLFLFLLLTAVFYFLLVSTGYQLPGEGEQLTAIEYTFIFLTYVIGAFSLALTEAGIANTVYTRIRGGDATLANSLKTAFSHWPSLLLWSVITSTVGLILRVIAERSKLLGRIVVLVLGVAWSVLTFFVVPAMVIDKKSAFSSIHKSKEVFKTTWGETLVSTISIGIVFVLVHILLLIVFLGFILLFVMKGYLLWLLAFGILYVLILIGLLLLQSSMSGIIKTLLYVYASEGILPPNFNHELLEKMLERQNAKSDPNSNVPNHTMTQTV